MITNEHQELLRKAVATNEKEKIKSTFRKVLKEEFGAINGLNPVAQEYVGELAKLIVVPSKIEVNISQNEEPEEKQASNGGLQHLLVSLIALVGVSVIGDKFGMEWGICLSVVLAILAFFFVKKGAGKNVPNVVEQPKASVVETYDENVLIELVDNLSKEVKGLVRELVDLNTNESTTVQLPLHECYPNILKWLQMVYADALDFDEESKKYLLKRIVSIAHSCYYDVVSFNGSNEELFKNEVGYNIDAEEMFSPAIIYNKTGKVILPGKIYIPSK